MKHAAVEMYSVVQVVVAAYVSSRPIGRRLVGFDGGAELCRQQIGHRG